MAGDRVVVERIRRAAQENFDFERLHPGQEEAIRAVMAGQDTLVVMPTGSGKSAIYQIAAQMLPGPAVVISPLIALQRDQLETIQEQQLGSAVTLNSTLSTGDRHAAVEALAAGEVEFLFLAPEQFGNPDTLEQIRQAEPSLFVVDEAHCISAWGHDFRPDYLRLGAVIESLGHPTVLALTATAAPPVREEIVERLGMRRPRVLVKGFDRPNITLAVQSFADERTKLRELIARLEQLATPGIVYTATRRHAEEMADAIREAGVAAACYHAGMKASEREAVQNAFMGDEITVIVATIAFGMGVDKPNVRSVLHYDISDSLDSYYQEIGRAGRDGGPAEAILFYRSQDLGIHRFLNGGGHADPASMDAVLHTVQAHGGPVEPRVLREETSLSQSALNSALVWLSDAGLLQLLPTGDVDLGRQRGSVDAALEEADRRQQQHRQFERSRLEMMRGYAETEYCRRAFLLNYFGEDLQPPCNNCDNCLAGITRPEDRDSQPFPLQSRVRHVQFGTGVVQRYEGDTMTVLFDEIGYKTLSASAVVEDRLVIAVAEPGSGATESRES